MNLPVILLIIGLVSTIASFFFGNSSSKYADELEKVSISLHQETNGLKKRLKNVEEELLMGVGVMNSSTSKKAKQKPVHEIIVNQILSLHSQGYSINDIATRSSLSQNDVRTVLEMKGVNS